MELENAKLEAALRHEQSKVELLQKQLDESKTVSSLIHPETVFLVMILLYHVYDESTLCALVYEYNSTDLILLLLKF